MKKAISGIRGAFFRNGAAWIRFIDENGKLRRESTGQPNKKVAEKVLAVRRAEVAEGRYIPLRRFERISFEALADIWWTEHGKDTRSCFAFVFPRIKRYFSGVRAASVTSNDVKNFMLELAQKYSPDYVNSHRTVVNGIFSYAIQTRRFNFNPVPLVPQMHTKGRERLITPDEFRRLLDKCKPKPELYCYVMLGGTTTMRSGEILQRQWGEICINRESPHFKIPRTKNDDPKIVPLPKVAVKAIENLPSFGTNQYLFPGRPNHRYPDPTKFKKPHRWDFLEEFDEAARAAGIEDLHFHDLRHLGSSILMAQGIPDAAFAYAESYDEVAARYRGLRYSTHVGLTRDDASLLVKPEAARKQIEQETAPPVPTGGGTATGTTGKSGESPVTTTRPPVPVQPPKPKRYHGTVVLDSERVGRDAGRIADEVITHLVGLLGSSVQVTLEIDAEIPDGAPDNVVRTVTENGRTLKFKTHGFEEK